MKKKINITILLLSFVMHLLAQKKPTKIGLIQEFSGVITNSGSYDYMSHFVIKDSKVGEVHFYFSTNMNDKYKLECDISNDLYSDLDESNANRKKIKVKAKSTYGVFDNYESSGPPDYKTIIWRPIMVKEL